MKSIADPALRDWLLDSDPALRWQVQRDLLGVPSEVWARERARVATEGYGVRLLALQDADGQPWTATTWTLNTPREFGLDPAALAGTAERLAASGRWDYDDLP